MLHLHISTLLSKCVAECQECGLPFEKSRYTLAQIDSGQNRCASPLTSYPQLLTLKGLLVTTRQVGLHLGSCLLDICKLCVIHYEHCNLCITMFWACHVHVFLLSCVLVCVTSFLCNFLLLRCFSFCSYWRTDRAMYTDAPFAQGLYRDLSQHCIYS